MKVLASALFLLLVILQLQLWFGSHGAFHLWSLQRTNAKALQDNNDLLQRNERLHAEVQELKQGKDALEERARSQLGLIKEGETFYRVIQKKQKDGS